MRLPRVIRESLRPVAGRIPVPIVGGLNRGSWWNLASAGSGYATGRRGPEQMEVLASLVGPGDCMWDVGAHHGYMTLCAARRVGPAGHVYAFEPSAGNHVTLARHLRWNRLGNVDTMRVALSDFEGETVFGGTGTTKTFALGAGDERVRVSRGATLVRRGTCRAPTVMKIDVEGAEASVIRGMGDALLRNARLMVAVHSSEAFTDVCAALSTRGFRILPSAELHRCLRTRWHGDPDLVALGPACDVDALNPALRRYLAA